ncbi:MAG: polysaccharide deacetylase family protein [Patescibacteria group bacterium]
MNPVILTFDLEYWFESLSLQRYLKGNERENLESFTEKILPLLKNNKATATFFVTGKVIENEPNLIKKINDAGQEIGLHSLDHRPLWQKNSDNFKKEIEILVDKITALTSKRPVSHRAVNFSLDSSTFWALPVLASKGIKFDSSLFPFSLPNFIFKFFKSRNYGHKKGEINPYQINGIKEMPLAVFDGKLIRIPIAGGVYLRIIPWFVFRKLLRLKLKNNPACLYFHPFDFLGEPPDFKMPKIRKIIKYGQAQKTWKKLNYVLKNFDCLSIENYNL